MLIMQPNFFIFIICNGKKAYYSFLLFIYFLSFAILIQSLYTFNFKM